MNQRIVCFTAVVIGMSTGSVFAQDFDADIDSNASDANLDSAIVFDSSGTLIGDYDSKTNPDGTQTRAGFFGGSGNNPIETSLTLTADTSLDTNPTGSFDFSIDLDLSLIEMNGLDVDIINGQSGGTALSVTLMYSTFHTVSPSFLYPGGVPITLPLGQLGGVSAASLTQTAPGGGALTSTDDPAIFDFLIAMPAQLDMVVNQSLPGTDPTDIPIDALPILLPIAGQLEIISDEIVVMTMSLQPDPITLEIPIDGATLPDIPFELPTLGSETASVIFSSTPNSISLDALLDLTIVSTGNSSMCAADLNQDGDLNFFDVSAFLGAFSIMDPIADFDSNGEFNFFDVSSFLAAFAQGCP
ncbi:MAG: GC-type dockerin domain-anchored protein [Phycisphaerales bacterium]|nr:GC-type dockerin domain-anchored protein [Phycisphaerales bacterium]